MSDTQPRYTTDRLREEIAKAKSYARREAIEEAAVVAESYLFMGWRGSELPAAIRALGEKA